MSAPDPDSPEAFASDIRSALVKGFIIPLIILGFFALAPAWLNHNLHSSVQDSINRSSLSSDERARRLEIINHIDFATVCGATPVGLEKLRNQFEQSGVCGQFHRLQWGFWLSVLLVALLVGATVGTAILNRRAQRSRDDLIAAYGQAWRLSTTTALLKVLLLIPLMAYGTFELSVLATERYFPKLIIIIVIGGLIALWRGISILMQSVPMEFEAPMARTVTPAEAPQLWAETKAAAGRLGTEPPDHILVGMENNFYVTELAVNYQGGQTVGRTLYLSLPLMQQLAPDEVLSIIGHELGHFRGDDTKLTREFYPMRLKAQATMQALAQSGWVGWPSVHALLFFHGTFARTEQALSREREFVADRAGAELTSPTVAARALTKIHVFAEAFMRTLKTKAANPFTVPLAGLVRAELVSNAEFWRNLFEQKSAHPLDSHPSLRLRLEALGQSVDPELAKSIATADTATAYSRWFEGQDGLFTGIQAEAMQAIEHMRTATADYETAEGKQLLDAKFPEVCWPGRSVALWIKSLFFALFVGIAITLFFVVYGWMFKTLMIALAVLFSLPIVILWRRHHGGEFVLRADSLNYTGWLRPLLFSEIANISAHSDKGSITVTFHLKEKTLGRWKYSLFNWIRSDTFSLEMGLMIGNQSENLALLESYIMRRAD